MAHPQQDRVIHYLIVFDHGAQRAAEEVREFGDSVEAAAAYEAAERRFANRGDIEVVLIGSDSLETIKFTHPNYFCTPRGLSDLVDRVLAG